MKKKYRVREGSIAYWAIYIGEGILFLGAMVTIYNLMWLLGI